jgi:hypothetical protein
MLVEVVVQRLLDSSSGFTCDTPMIRTLAFFYIRYPARLRHQLFGGPGDRKYELAPFSLKTRTRDMTEDVKIYIYKRGGGFRGSPPEIKFLNPLCLIKNVSLIDYTFNL